MNDKTCLDLKRENEKREREKDVCVSKKREERKKTR